MSEFHTPAAHAALGAASQLQVDYSALLLQIDLQSRPDGKHAKLEKYLLRKAFDVPEAPYLPESVLWRQKEQFSDGVGYSWVDGLKEYANDVRLENMHTVMTAPTMGGWSTLALQGWCPTVGAFRSSYHVLMWDTGGHRCAVGGTG